MCIIGVPMINSCTRARKIAAAFTGLVAFLVAASGLLTLLRPSVSEVEQKAMNTHRVLDSLLGLSNRLYNNRHLAKASHDRANALEEALKDLKASEDLIPEARSCLFLLFSVMEQIEEEKYAPGVLLNGEEIEPDALLNLRGEVLRRAIDAWEWENSGWYNFFIFVPDPVYDRVFRECEKQSSPEMR